MNARAEPIISADLGYLALITGQYIARAMACEREMEWKLAFREAVTAVSARYAYETVRRFTERVELEVRTESRLSGGVCDEAGLKTLKSLHGMAVDDIPKQ
jgi:hypothetical protein